MKNPHFFRNDSNTKYCTKTLAFKQENLIPQYKVYHHSKNIAQTISPISSYSTQWNIKKNLKCGNTWYKNRINEKLAVTKHHWLGIYAILTCHQLAYTCRDRVALRWRFFLAITHTHTRARARALTRVFVRVCVCVDYHLFVEKSHLLNLLDLLERAWLFRLNIFL